MASEGELRRIYYDMTGDWELDSKNFIKAQLEMEKLAGIIDTEYEE